jgi:C4-dicarboxylate transporter DctM subunit
MTVLVILFGLFALLLFGIPVAFALGGLGSAMLAYSGFSFQIAPAAILSSMDSFVLIAVPLFLLMSNVMLKGGVGKDLFEAVQAWVGHLPGGLAVATVLSCGIFATISGSSVATAATIGTVAIPEMTQRGYPRNFVFGLLAAGGTLGILIPPSLIMIIYAVITEESVLTLFLAGIGPGLVLMGLFIAYSVLFAMTSKSYQPQPKSSWKVRVTCGRRALPTVLLSAAVIVGIYRGWYTPTEAAAIGFLGALFVTGVLLRTLTWQGLKEAVLHSMRTTVSVLLIVAGAKVFGKAIALYRIPQDISLFISDNINSPIAFIAMVAVVLLIMGLFMEALSMMLIMVPVLITAVMALGIDPIWFGIFFVVMIECALITPPVGLNLFVIQSVGEARMQEFAAGVLPFLLLMLVTVALMVMLPQVVLWLPSVL